MLVFLSGESEIRDAADAVAGRFGADTEVVPLYGRLSSAEQHRVFDTKRTPGIRRRVVLATNVAETSLTVPGIRYVIDAGTARISRYSPRAKVQRLPIEAISQATANQRSGRAGRTSAGIAIRLYAEDDFDRRPAYTDPEVLRTGLAAVILQMISICGSATSRAFPFLQPPDSRGIADGIDLLRELGAVDRPARSRITRVGRDLARLPVDPRFGRMLVEAKKQGVVREVAAIVAGLSIQDPRERPLEKRPQADAAHARFRDPTSDFVSLLNLWNHLEEQQKERSGSAFRRHVQGGVPQLPAGARVAGPVPAAACGPGSRWASPRVDRRRMPTPSTVRILAGLLSPDSACATRTKKDYLGSRGQRFVIFPGSGLAKKQPNAVMAAELVETVAPLRAHRRGHRPGVGRGARRRPRQAQLRRAALGEASKAAAVACEKVTLYGLPIVPRRRVQLARIDPELARELFIRHALVEGDWPHDLQRSALLDFDRDNEKLRRRARRGGGAHPAPRHPHRRRGRLRVLRAPHPRRRDRQPTLRELVEGDAGGTAGSAHHGSRRSARGRRRGRRRRPSPTSGCRATPASASATASSRVPTTTA